MYLAKVCLMQNYETRLLSVIFISSCCSHFPAPDNAYTCVGVCGTGNVVDARGRREKSLKRSQQWALKPVHCKVVRRDPERVKASWRRRHLNQSPKVT